MTRQEVVKKAMQKTLGWSQAAVILGVTERQVRRIRRRMEQLGVAGLVDRRHLPRKKRISAETVSEIRTYAAANRYLERTFLPDFNSRFAVEPAQAESAFARVDGVDLDLLVSIHHARVVRNDNTVFFNNRVLQLPTTSSRPHHVRCDVTVHEFVDGDLGVSYQDRLLLRVGREGLRKRLRGPTGNQARRNGASSGHH
jgi:hypothetical protein